MPLPDPIIEVLTVFRPLFTAPTWRKLMTLLRGREASSFHKRWGWRGVSRDASETSCCSRFLTTVLWQAIVEDFRPGC